MPQRLPAPPLRAFVKLLWISGSEAPRAGANANANANAREHVMPSGEMHLVFRLSGPPVRVFEEGASAPHAMGHAVVGGARSSFYAKEVVGPATSIGAQLYPGASEYLFGASSEELAERHTPLSDLWGGQAALALAQLQAAPTPDACMNVLEQWLAARLPVLRGLHPAVAQALRVAHGAQRVDALVRASGYSHRQFNALFRRAVGLSPKAYVRVLRFQSVLQQSHRLAALQAPADWADLALQAGFSDQAHFNREFRAMAGVTPEAYRQGVGAHAAHLQVKFVQDARKPPR
jgi:AraC-like DNA-binding protein